MQIQLALLDQQRIPMLTSACPDRCTERLRLEQKFASLIREEPSLGPLVSYVANKQMPILGLYRYKEAFGLQLVEEFISRFRLTAQDYLFDPFCGMGTALFTAALKGIPAIGVDKLPVPVFVAQTLPLFFSLKSGELRATYDQWCKGVEQATPAPVAMDVAIMKVAFTPGVLLNLRKWKAVIDELEPPLREIFLLLFFSILEPCSYASKDGQFLRLKRDKRLADPEVELHKLVNEAEKDVAFIRQVGWDKAFRLPAAYLGDARDLSDLPFEREPTAIITSPPYVNRYDYTRTYSLELCFHFVQDFAGLRALRHSLLRSHIESKVENQEQPPHSAVAEVVDILKGHGKALNNPRIPHMLTAYFVDMEKVIREWSRVLAPGAVVAMVVDNVRFEGEMLPVDLVLSEMAEAVDFQVEEVMVARYKGNSSQQMGKYGRVPVRESIVVWRKR
jgi:hypothetical protein